MEKKRMKMSELLSYIEFKLEKTEDNTYRLIDLQHANLGGIEDEVFHTPAEIIERCTIYWRDYEIFGLCEDLNVSESDFKDWEELYEFATNFYGEDKVDKNTILYWLINPEMVDME